MLRFSILAGLFAYLALVGVVALAQRSLLYFPSHRQIAGPLAPWAVEAAVIGFCREVEAPREVWLMLHGNGGQAAQRAYMLEHVAKDAAFYVLEYPGYGDRPGKPSLKTINAAAAEAWSALRARYPGVPIGVIGESIGSGAACTLAAAAPPPDKIVLWVPFNRLSEVAAEHLRWLPAGWLLRDRWDNGAALAGYAGPVEIHGARDDQIIPLHHAQALAARVPGARYSVMPGGHNDWQWRGVLRVRDPVTTEPAAGTP